MTEIPRLICKLCDKKKKAFEDYLRWENMEQFKGHMKRRHPKEYGKIMAQEKRSESND